jgi:NAD(P)-dependent dehydrogenase (short-subunit alcohol dehydrogenase family)
MTQTASCTAGVGGALAGKSALVTGGGRGIGAAIARALSTAVDARVALVGRAQAALTTTGSDPIHHQPRRLALPHTYTCSTCGETRRERPEHDD